MGLLLAGFLYFSWDSLFVVPPSAERSLVAGTCREHAHLLLEGHQLNVDRAGHCALFELFKVLRQAVARELFFDLDRCLELTLVRFDALFHARERLERRLLRHRRHRFSDALLRLRATLPSDK